MMHDPHSPARTDFTRETMEDRFRRAFGDEGDALLECYRSGQIAEADMVQRLRDKGVL